MNPVLLAALVVGVTGMVLGAVLALASKVFYVEKDPRVDAVLEVLPGANCGGCGKAGCAAMAESIVKGESPVNGCPVGGAPVAEEVSKILGVEAGDFVKMVSFVHCTGCKEDCAYKYEYTGDKDCVEAFAVQGGNKACDYGCLGYGSCVKACKFDALKINEKGLAEVDPEKCTACGACIEVCPKGILSLVPYQSSVKVKCNNKQKGKSVKEVCARGCITCGICAKNCPFEAIKINEETNLPVIDYTKCRECLICYEKCPQHIIVASSPRKRVSIDETKCIGCGLCKKKCPKDAIEGELKQPHKIDPAKCIGCTLCADACKKSAVIVED